MNNTKSEGDYPIIKTPCRHFGARELEPDPKPLPPDELQDGTVYFSITYADEDMLIPVMDTVVFIGRNLKADEVGVVYFQDIYSYRDDVRFGSETEDDFATFSTRPVNNMVDIFEYERALEELMRCSIRRRQAQG